MRLRKSFSQSLYLVWPLGLAIVHAALATPAMAARLPIDPDKPHLVKATSHLLHARAAARAGEGSEAVVAAMSGWEMRAGRASVEIKLSSLTPELLTTLQKGGLTVFSHSFEHARAYGWIDPARLSEITALSEVRVMRPMPRSGTRAGSVTSQGDATMRTDDVRSMTSADGSGVVVGILSDSFNATLGGSESGGPCACSTPGSTCANVVTGMSNQTSGDLPPSAGILDDCTAGSPNCDVLSDEGAAIGELIFDSAPGAAFLFHSAFNTPADFAMGITELANCGSNIIVDDIFWTGQPFFQDGIIAKAAQDAVDAEVHYFSAAGNDATFGVNDAFADSDPVSDNTLFPPDGKDFHDFGGSDLFAAVSVPDDCDLFAELQWSEPFDNGLGTAAAMSDLDLYFLSSPADPASTGGANILAASTSAQGCGIPAAMGGDPDEAAIFTNTTGGPVTVFLAVDHFCGSEDLELRIITLSFLCGVSGSGSGFDFENGFDGFDAMGDPIPDASETPIFVDSQIFGHPAAEGAIAVGASFFGEIDSGGTLDPPSTQLDVEPFSSLGGPLPFYFDSMGMPLPPPPPPGAGTRLGPRPGTRDGPPSPEVRHKPEIVGPDGTNTTFFGTDIGFDADLFPNFFGTSAAAPNAVGVAALIEELTSERLTPKALKSILRQTVLDMEIPGFDDLSGDGFIDALRPTLSFEDGLGDTELSDDLVFDLDGDAFFKSGFDPSGFSQTLRSKNSLLLRNGDYSGLSVISKTVIFADGFETGNTSSWSNSP